MLTRRAVLGSLGWLGAGLLLPGCTGSTRPPVGREVVRGQEVALSSASRAAGLRPAVPATVDGIQEFSVDLYRRLAVEPGNLVASPYSVAVALAMTRNGARGRTAVEMDQVLQAPQLGRFNGGMNALVQLLESRAGARRRRVDDTLEEVALDAANSLWGQRDITWLPPFLDALARYYGAGMRLVDYQADPEAVRVLINRWTSEQTHGKIPRLIPPRVLDPTTRLVLVNALYFKAAWEEPFEKAFTRRRPFHAEAGSTAEVDMMSQDLHRAAYATGPGWRAARLAYIGSQIAMAVVVPDQPSGLRAVEASLDGPALSRLLSSFRPVPVIRVRLPRWRFRVNKELGPHLAALGMPTAFQPLRADFSGMTGSRGLFISHVLHDAFIAVDEQGTEAAAATAVIMNESAAPAPPTLTLTADRPFLFVLFDVETATPLFLGRVTNPTGT